MNETSDSVLTGETGVIGRTLTPRTRASLAADLRGLGVRPGDVLLVHSSLSALGWVVGRELTVVEALLDAVGGGGTLVVPTQTGGNSDPAEWSHPPVPESWWDTIRAHLPAYDPATMPATGMGVVAEAVRTWPGALRSSHPQTSFAALGARASSLLAVHDLDCRFGLRSPLGALRAAGARVLLIGAGYDSCTAFHLAETLVPGAPEEEQACAVVTGRGRAWVRYTDTVADETDFVQIGAGLDATGAVRAGRVGSAVSRLFDLATGVAYATRWIRRHRGPAWQGGRSADTV
ncbi:MAG TPA: AAC(3) family N-acetyltransferase [Cryptosporangiaceae bacterium]|nr:AAC(3) family N-acetyltransferase [Cryptosporangiaceae bacterium]